jgi:hypothetical protein
MDERLAEKALSVNAEVGTTIGRQQSVLESSMRGLRSDGKQGRLRQGKPALFVPVRVSTSQRPTVQIGNGFSGSINQIKLLFSLETAAN